MKRFESNAAYWIPAGFTFAVTVAVFAAVAAMAVDDVALLGDADVRWKMVGALVAVSTLLVAVGAMILKNWQDLLERRRRESVFVIELDGLAVGTTFEGTVLPGGTVRFQATAPAVPVDGNVVPLARVTRAATPDVSSAG